MTKIYFNDLIKINKVLKSEEWLLVKKECYVMLFDGNTFDIKKYTKNIPKLWTCEK